jgi:hypothetical protein
MKALTIAAAKAALAARAPAMTLRKTDGGDFRVTFTQAAIAAAFPAMTRAELIEKAESLAAYESDAESALATGLAMAETGLQPAPATADEAAPEADKPGREYIDMTPTWAAMESTFRLLIENGNAEGRRTAWAEIAKALRLADERNEMAAELRRRETADLSDVIQAYEMRSDGVQAAGAIVLRRLPDNDATPFVVHFRNDADSERMGRPCYYSGDYCATLADAWAAFGEKCRRYDPTGALAA